MINQSISHYKIVEKLGEGGMGEVYLAEDTALGRKVALKLLPPHYTSDAEFNKRFRREAKAAAALNHPNIITVYEIGEHEGRAFIAMEYVEGESLREVVSSGQLAVNSAVDIAAQICDGLSAAHQAGIIHRDIKPENIIIDKFSRVRILDFGLAGMAGVSKLTKAGSTLGTVSYMAPEQFRGQPVDQRADIWAAGVVLYEMLAGELPFQGEYEQAVMYMVLNEEPESVSSLRSEMPEELAAATHKALAKNASERYQSSAELLGALHGLRGGQNPGNSTSHTVESRRTVSLRNRIILYMSLAIILLVAGFAYFFNRSQPIESVAILPFVNSNNDPNLEYLSDGVTETLINKLSQLPQLRVMARSTVFHFKGKDMTPQQVGEQLNVRAVLTGEIMQRGETLYIVAELVDVSDGAQLWGAQFTPNLDKIIAVQDTISERISSGLRLKLSTVEKNELTKKYTENKDAYLLYLKGRYYLNKRTGEDLKIAQEYFQQALNLDPTYALAYAGMADCYLLLPIYRVLTGKESYPRAKASALKALQIDEQLAEAHSSLATAYVMYGWDWVSAEKSFRRAIELNPNYAVAHQWYGSFHLVWQGRFDEAISEVKRAIELDPLSLIINQDLGLIHFFARNYNLAIDQLEKTLEMDQSFYIARYRLGAAYIFYGDIPKGMDQLKKAFQISDDPKILAAVGFGYAISGNTKEAERVLVGLNEISTKRAVSPYDYATIYAGLRNTEKALEYLQKCLEQQEWSLVKIKNDPFMDNLRSNARFIEILKAVGLDE